MNFDQADVYQLIWDLQHNANGISHEAAVHQCSDAVASFCALQTKCCWDLQEGSEIQFPVYLGLLVTLRLVNKSAEELKFSSCHLGGWCKRSIIDRLLSPRRAVCCLLLCAPQKRSLEDE